MTNGRPSSKPVGIIGSIGEFGGDLITLAELQTKLTIIDLKDTTAEARNSVLAVVAASALALGSIPVLIFGLALLLADWLKLSQGWALVLTGGLFVVIAGAVLAFAGRLAVKSTHYFRRSSEELTRNLAWIKTVVGQSGR